MPQQSDSYGGYFLSAGLRSGSPNVYSLGLGMGGAYMGSGFYQADLLVREGRIGGGTLTGGLGILSAFLIARVGYDSFSGLPVVEVGATVKLPLFYFKY